MIAVPRAVLTVGCIEWLPGRCSLPRFPPQSVSSDRKLPVSVFAGGKIALVSPLRPSHAPRNAVSLERSQDCIPSLQSDTFRW